MSVLGNMIKACKRINQLSSQIGWFNTGLFILNRFLVKISHRNIRLYKYYLIAQPVSSRPLLTPNRGRKIVIRPIDAQDPVIQFFPRPLSVIQERFKSGALCLVAFKDEKFVGFIWLMLGYYQEDEVRARFVPLPADSAAWDFDIYVDPDHRLGFAFLRLWDEANQILSGEGIQWSCSRIAAFNSNSLKSHAGFGTVTLGQAIFLRMGNWQLTLASLRPYVHLSFHPDSFPEFHLETHKLNSPFSTQEGETTLE
jgi:hypothetical protein